MQDFYGLSISTSGPAVDAWLQGLEAGFSFDSSGIEQHSKALELAPDFALAHTALARQLLIHGQRDAAYESLTKACSLRSRVSEREASQINIVSANMNYRADALDLALAHIERWPLDITVFSMLIGPFGMLAFSGQATWRTDCLALLQKHQHRWPSEDWWYQSALAFALAETAETEAHGRSQLGVANEHAESAWQLKETGNCAHTLSHIHYEQGDLKSGRVFLQRWLASHGQTSDMRHHLVWHDVLYTFDSGVVSQAVMTTLYQNEFDPAVADPMPLTTFADNASLLWRCRLYGTLLDIKYVQQTVGYANQYFPSLGFSFADVHRVLVTALLGNDKEIESLAASIGGLENRRTANYLEQLLIGAIAFTQGEYLDCAARLQPLIAETVLIGGSNPQRAIVRQTYERSKFLAGSLA